MGTLHLPPWSKNWPVEIQLFLFLRKEFTLLRTVKNGIYSETGICSKLTYVRKMTYDQKLNSKKTFSYPEIYARTSPNAIQSSHRSLENSFVSKVIHSIFIEKLFSQTSTGKFPTPVMVGRPLDPRFTGPKSGFVRSKLLFETT